MTEPSSMLLAAVSLAAIGTAIGIVAAAWRHRHEQPGTSWLLGTIAAIAASGLGDAARPWPLPGGWLWLDAATSSALLCIGPCLWLYAREVTARPGDARSRVRRGNPWRHFWPALALVLLLSMHAAKHEADAPTPSATSPSDRIALALVGLHLAAYLAGAMLLIRRARRVVASRWSSMQGRDLRWLETADWALIALAALWWAAAWTQASELDAVVGVVAWVAMIVIGSHCTRQQAALGSWRRTPSTHSNSAALSAGERARTESDPGVAAPPAPTGIEALGLTAQARHGLTDSAIHTGDHADAHPGAHANIRAEAHTDIQAAFDTDPSLVGRAPKYAKAPLPTGLAAELDAKLDALMARERLFTDNELTLGDLAQALRVSSHHLSQYLTRHRGANFFDYVNRLRVDAFCAAMDHIGDRSTTVIEVAFACGFGSKSAFNAAFKRHRGVTPTAWRRRSERRGGLSHGPREDGQRRRT